MSPFDGRLSGLRVLVVEDEAMIAEELRARLSARNMNVVEVVDNAADAFSAAERHRPDLVLMDVRLKGTRDGVSASAAIAGAFTTPVVFLTAHADDETLRRARLTEPYGYVVKPFEERELLIAIELAVHRHEIQGRLRESERRLGATLASIGDGVIATDRAGRVTFVNPVAEALSGWRAGLALEREIEDVLPIRLEATGTLREHPVTECLRTGRTVTLVEPSVAVARSGERIPIDDTAAPITDDAGRVIGAVMAFRDIRGRRLTEDALRQARDQLRQAEKMSALGRLAGGIAHDFNNLLMIINGYAELLIERAESHDLPREMAEEIRGAARRATELTSQLMTFSRQREERPAAVAVGELLSGCLRLLDRLVAPGVSIRRDVITPLAIRVDPVDFETALMNLVLNARDALPNGGLIRLTVDHADLTAEQIAGHPGVAPGTFVRVSLRDDGVGIDPSLLPRVFEPFFTTKEPGRGTGLGLANVFAFARRAGGFIEVRSQPGAGSDFILHLPAESEATALAAPSRADEQAAHRAATILLVDDDPGIRNLLATDLRRLGHTVHVAASGAAARQVWRRHGAELSLVIASLNLPDISGRVLVESLPRDGNDPAILYITGYHEDPVLERQVRDRRVNLLHKPFSLGALAAAVRRALETAGGPDAGSPHAD
jgi:hypothetical protein